MNISHTNDNEQNDDNECEYTKAFLKESSDSPAVKNSDAAINKVFELLADATPNYVLGYN
ncbi:hypothetical protein [Thalassomonas actiniarum]|uniref:Uncharacterized protein n=1 Tax=Thalassomonas actiniarum TaxID=485447 RepID=A0AAE9YI06_9GAMM|nr:hypothetical protein [Thalassomonas actiniarum]WDD96755.1 hypothetical protein SG35_015365 [Thalassomonas actiniarum]